MKISRSIIQQAAKGTLERNRKIIKLYDSGIINNMAELGRMFSVSRQAINNIIKRGRE